MGRNAEKNQSYLQQEDSIWGWLQNGIARKGTAHQEMNGVAVQTHIGEESLL
jgi:hypothetical protein